MPLISQPDTPPPINDRKEVNLLLIGDSHSGKSAFAQRFTGQGNIENYEPTIIDRHETFY